MAEMNFKININKVQLDALVEKIEAMSEYMETAGPEDSFAVLASAIGEIDADKDITIQTEFVDGQVLCKATPQGSLAVLISAFDAVQN